MTNPQTIEKAKKLGQLLASSPLELELKMAILENLSAMPEKYLDALIVSLENEARGIEIILKEAEDFMKQQDEDWAKLEVDQQVAVDKIVADELKEMDKEEKINSIRVNIGSAI